MKEMGPQVNCCLFLNVFSVWLAIKCLKIDTFVLVKVLLTYLPISVFLCLSAIKVINVYNWHLAFFSWSDVISLTCSNPRYSWVTYFILSNICNVSQLVLSISSTHTLFALSIFVTLSIFHRLINLLSSSHPLWSFHFLRYFLIL